MCIEIDKYLKRPSANAQHGKSSTSVPPPLSGIQYADLAPSSGDAGKKPSTGNMVSTAIRAG